MKYKSTIFLIAITCMLFLIPFTSATWNIGGNMICSANANQQTLEICCDNSGSTILVWSDYRNSNWDIYAQRVDLNGIAKWDYNGKAISDGANNQIYPKICCSGNGTIIVWGDNRGGGLVYDIYAQKIDSAGYKQWDVDGILVCNVSGLDMSDLSLGSIQMCCDGNGGAIIVWRDFRGGATSDLYAQRVNQEGEVQWTENGINICSAADDQWGAKIISDNNGGAIITWMDARGSDTDTYIQKINASGGIEWDSNGIVVCNANEFQWNPELTTDGDQGAIITWQDARVDGGFAEFDIYAQKVNKNGIISWTPNGTSVSTSIHKQYSPKICADKSGGAYIVWEDNREGNNDIYAQHLNSLGNPLFQTNGIAVCAEAYSQLAPDLCVDKKGNAIIVWHDQRNGTSWDIYAQYIDSAGNAKWINNGKSICSEQENQWNAVIAYNNFNGVVIAWEDQRIDGTTADIYASYVKIPTSTPESIPGVMIGFLLIGILSIVILKCYKYSH